LHTRQAGIAPARMLEAIASTKVVTNIVTSSSISGA
jgi:hypothetical protein